MNEIIDPRDVAALRSSLGKSQVTEPAPPFSTWMQLDHAYPWPTVMIDVKPRLYRGLRRLARSFGLTVDEVAASMIEQGLAVREAKGLRRN